MLVWNFGAGSEFLVLVTPRLINWWCARSLEKTRFDGHILKKGVQGCLLLPLCVGFDKVQHYFVKSQVQV